jgi:hypothetical protein
MSYGLFEIGISKKKILIQIRFRILVLETSL